MDATQWPREAALAPPSGGGRANPPVSAGMERRTHRQNDQPLNCPRCNSNVTKFCYYNNYSLTQPRYFCKTCRRYWTEGGSLRNVPVGGGSRKNKRSSVAAAAAAKPPGALTSSSSSIQNPKFTEVQDLNIGFSHGVGGLPELESFSNMELLRGIEIGGGPIRSFIQVPHEIYSTGFGLQDFRGRSTLGLGYPLGAVGGGRGAHGGDEQKFLFPSTADAELELSKGQGGDTPGFWNGMLGGGGAW